MHPEEIKPFVLLHVEADEVKCALWRLHQGDTALALFLTDDSATAYRDRAGLSGWQVFQPERESLLELLSAHVQAGIRLGVLDPDMNQCRRLFDLDAVVRSARAGPS
jgi:hypothetical protein